MSLNICAYSGQYSFQVCVGKILQFHEVLVCFSSHRIGHGSNADVLCSTNFKPELKVRAMNAAQELMAGLYLAFPVPVRTVLQDQKSQAVDLSLYSQDHKFVQGKCWQVYH